MIEYGRNDRASLAVLAYVNVLNESIVDRLERMDESNSLEDSVYKKALNDMQILMLYLLEAHSNEWERLVKNNKLVVK